MAIRINLCIADLGNQSIALVESTGIGMSAITDYLDNPIKANTAKFVDVKPLTTPATVFPVLDSGVVKSRTGSELLADIGGIGSVMPHDLLSATHDDTASASPQNDDLIVGAGGTVSGLKITIPKEKLPAGGLTNFPVLISEEFGAGANKLSALSDFWSGIADATNGLDIRYYSDEAYSTELKCERVFLDVANKKIEHWLQIPSCSSAADYPIYVKVGGTNGNNDLTMWSDASAVVVKHAQNNYLDSSGNGNDGSSSFSYADGKIGKCFHRTGGSAEDNVLPSTALLQFVNNFCVSCWAKYYEVNAYQMMVSRLDGANFNGSNDYSAFQLRNNAGIPQACISSDTGAFAYVSGSALDGNFHLCTMRYADGTLYLYIDGILKSSLYVGWDISSRIMNTCIGASFDGLFSWSSHLDEVRIYNADHDIDWFATEYANQNSPETFASCETVTGSEGDSATWQRKAHGNDGDVLNYSTADGVAWKSLSDVGIEPKGAADAVEELLDTHEGLTTTAHGGIVASNDSRLSDARTPTGTASGDLSGTYPSPTVAKLNGHSLPANSAGYLKNDGSGNLSIATPSYSDVGAQQVSTMLSAFAALDTSLGLIEQTGAITITKLSGLTENTLPIADANNSIKDSLISQAVNTSSVVTFDDKASSSGVGQVYIKSTAQNGTQAILSVESKDGSANIKVSSIGLNSSGELCITRSPNLGSPDAKFDTSGNLKINNLAFLSEQTATITGDTTINPTNSLIEITT